MKKLASLVLLASLGLQLQQGEDAHVDPNCEVLLKLELSAHAETRAECERLKARTVELERELARMEEERLVRETEWLGYTRVISGLSGTVIPADVVFKSTLEAEQQAVEEVRSAERLALESRSHEVSIALRSMFVAEGIEGYDFLEAGLVGDGFTGPVVLRMLDQMRRPIGSLSAARLRLEGSDTGHTLTLIFEEGYERRGGRKLPFEGGTLGDLSCAVRRIVLPSVDPRPWKEALPELFKQGGVEQSINDGKWDITAVRLRINELLREDAAAGHYSLHSVGGIRDEVLHGVHLERRDREGRITRRFFADSMRLSTLEKGVWITLEDGAQLRGDEKLPFMNGRFRIFVSGARLDAWCDGHLPGLQLPVEKSE